MKEILTNDMHGLLEVLKRFDNGDGVEKAISGYLKEQQNKMDEALLPKEGAMAVFCYGASSGLSAGQQALQMILSILHTKAGQIVFVWEADGRKAYGRKAEEIEKFVQKCVECYWKERERLNKEGLEAGQPVFVCDGKGLVVAMQQDGQELAFELEN